MKTYFLALIFLGANALTYSQDAITYAHFRAPRPVSPSVVNTTLTNTVNAKFMKVLRKDYMPMRAKALQKLVANYDISKASVFMPKQNSTYKVVMKEKKDASTTVYSYNGIILKSEQTFKSIRLPYNLSSKVIKEHPGWAIDQVDCQILYEVNENPLITYKVRLKQGKDTKNLELSI
ncbi:hypothetical protein [Arenibacter sp. F20364]|uniref:hypothetical protein n=1 Tax=Arenibacter sp. F20364 TaxID=2926415 RepID=UPI001FF5184F|nr:hypothetical protein [Arenibacter sp. F20364]MCK0189147.1 hypothetical protein [Arenibacter sp. F20364]